MCNKLPESTKLHKEITATVGNDKKFFGKQWGKNIL